MRKTPTGVLGGTVCSLFFAWVCGAAGQESLDGRLTLQQIGFVGVPAPAVTPVDPLMVMTRVEHDGNVSARGGRVHLSGRSNSSQSRRGRPGHVFRDCAECPEMVVVPAGRFVMGSPSSEEGRDIDEGPQHSVSVGRFALGRYEVTRGEFEAFATSIGLESSGPCYTMRGLSDGLSWRSPGFAQRDDHPVVCVSWVHARSYARWLSRTTGEAYRLPSESEWEYAARAGTTTRHWWGGSIGEDRANCAVNGCLDIFDNTAPVGSFEANRFGLFDMLGNVWEWVADCYHDTYRGAPTDGSAWTGPSGCRRVLRGGSWGGLPWSLRSAHRNWFGAGDRDHYVGFRVARTLD